MSVLRFQDFEAETQDFRRESPAAFSYLFGEVGRGFGKLLREVRHDSVEDRFSECSGVGLTGGQYVDEGAQSCPSALDLKPDLECPIELFLRRRGHDRFLVCLLGSLTLAPHPS